MTDDERANVAAAHERAELSRAQLNATLSALRELVGVIARVGGYMAPEDQQHYRHARGLLAEHGVQIKEH